MRAGEKYDDFTDMTIAGKLDDILESKEPVELKDIFRGIERKQKVVLLLGAHGSGKTTVSVYICQQWALNYLFSKCDLVIFIQLHDPAVHKATKLADIIPSQNDSTASRIAAEIEGNGGQNVLWILDGWDKLPHELRENSYLHMLVTFQRSPISESSIIVTSTPFCSSNLGVSYHRHPLYQSQVELEGLQSDQLQNYFTDYLQGDAETTGVLLEKLENNQIFAGLCGIPLLNASILGYVSQIHFLLLSMN